MESLSLALQDYKEIVGSVAGIVTIGQFLAGGFICKDIYKKGNTDGIPSMPFIGGIVIGTLMLQYSVMLNDAAMLNVNMAAIILNMLYLVFYLFFSQTKRDVLKSSGYGTAFVAVLIGYTRMENPELVVFRFGLIVTGLMLILIGSPLLEVKYVIVNKDASFIPFPIVLCGTVVSFLWLLYGIILMNDFMIVRFIYKFTREVHHDYLESLSSKFQNIIGLVLCAVQVILCILYPRRPAIKKKSE